jgi:hypothetical protein
MHPRGRAQKQKAFDVAARRGQRRFELRTSRTQSENHTTRPRSRLKTVVTGVTSTRHRQGIWRAAQYLLSLPRLHRQTARDGLGLAQN